MFVEHEIEMFTIELYSRNNVESNVIHHGINALVDAENIIRKIVG
jgi:hypothetical protein